MVELHARHSSDGRPSAISPTSATASPRPIRLLPCPLTMRNDQLGYTHYVRRPCSSAPSGSPTCTSRCPRCARSSASAPIEEEWLRECWTPAHRETNPVFGRLDAVVDYTSAMWKDSIKFMEPNLSGIGGLHMAATAVAILAELVVPALLEQDPSDPAPAPRRHARTAAPGSARAPRGDRPAGRADRARRSQVAAEGPDEPDALARVVQGTSRLSVLHADPSELRQRGDEVFYGDTRVDVVYRDAGVLDLIGLRARGRGRRADAHALPPEPRRLVDQRGARPEEHLRAVHRSRCWPSGS